VLRTTIELRGAPFALWMTDLSQPDTIAMIASFPIHVLPLLMGVGMLIQQRFSSQDPSQAALGKMMPIIFTALFYNFASGLVLYWLVNTVLSVWQQYYIHRGPTAAEKAAGAMAAPNRVPGEDATSTTDAPTFVAADSAVAAAQDSAPREKSSKRGGKRRKKKR
jgi:membrane protein insertase Oxa1/YidC/SpoIIIJ